MTCPVCGRPGRVEPGPPREVVERTVAGLLERLPLVRCEAGHERLADDPGRLGRAVLDHCRRMVPHARRRLLRPDACDTCREPLSMPVRRTERVVTVDGLAGLPVLTVHLDLPMTRCPACGLDQLPSRSQEHLADTVRRLTAERPDEQ